MGISKPTDAEILLDCEEIAGFKIRPWTISKCVALSPAFENIMGELKKRKLSFRDFFSVVKEKDKIEKVELMNLEHLIFSIMPCLPEVVSKTLDIPVERIDEIPQKDFLMIVTVIVRQNIDYLKNLFALMTTAMRELRTAV